MIKEGENMVTDYQKRIEEILKRSFIKSKLTYTKYIQWQTSQLLSLLQEVRSEERKSTAIKIIKGLEQFEYEHDSKTKCGNSGAIKWGIMKGWGIEPADL